MNKASLPYRPCVGIALFNDKGQVFVGERVDTPGAWQMPQGGIDDGEDIQKAALRELSEEIGIAKAKVLKIAAEKTRYDLPPHLKGLWGGKFRGQEQTWIAMRYGGKDSDINLNAHEPAEFQRWQWVDLHDALGLIVPFKRDTYLKVIDFFDEFAS
jgi:putative (di)nucleoside polyphosphate hydrolase